MTHLENAIALRQLALSTRINNDNERKALEAAASHFESLEERDSKSLWERDDIQFPRLLAEIAATQGDLDILALVHSMDLTPQDIDELFDRAQQAWERHKAKA